MNLMTQKNVFNTVNAAVQTYVFLVTRKFFTLNIHSHLEIFVRVSSFIYSLSSANSPTLHI
jgi:hypothetical protein